MNTLFGSLFSGLSYLLIFLLYLAGVGVIFGLVNRFLPSKDKR